MVLSSLSALSRQTKDIQRRPVGNADPRPNMALAEKVDGQSSCPAGPADSELFASQRRGRAAGAATLRRRGAEGCGRRALKARASTSDSPHLFERSERSERSELCGATADRAPQGSRPAGPTAAVGAEPAARPRLCALGGGGRSFASLRMTVRRDRLDA